MTTEGAYLGLITIMGMDTGMDMGMDMGMDTGMDMDMGIIPIPTILEKKKDPACFQYFAKNLKSL